MASRGLEGEGLTTFRLGYVSDPEPGHEFVKGRLAIPYRRYSPESGWSVLNMKFRCIEDHDCKEAHPKVGKYMGHPGGGTHIFNTVAIQTNQFEIAMCEGEIDAISSTLAGIPAVGIPGTENWVPMFARLFMGFEKVWMFADNDDVGQGVAMANRLASQIPNLKVVPMPEGFDVNSTVQTYGPQALFKAIGKEVP